MNQDGETKEYKTRLNRIRSYLRKTRGSYSVEEAFEGGIMDATPVGSSSSQVVGMSKTRVDACTVVACRLSSMYETYINFKNRHASRSVDNRQDDTMPTYSEEKSQK